MPKETISDPNGSYDVKVGWSSGQGVQLGVADPLGGSLFWTMLGSEDAQSNLVKHVESNLAALADEHPNGAPTLNKAAAILNAMDQTTIIVFDSLWSDLNRDRCNRLIRLLRKARDAAFGKDE